MLLLPSNPATRTVIEGLMQKVFRRQLMAWTVMGVVCFTGCKVEQMKPRDPAEDKKSAALPNEGVVTVVPGPTTDNAAQVIAACGPAASDELVTVNDKMYAGTVRRMSYNGGRHVTLDFIPLQSSPDNRNQPPSSNTVWRFNQAVVDDQKLLTAANIRVYLPCAANALAKEF
jgi:hypothetical protein